MTTYSSMKGDMHSLQQSIENDRTNPPIGSVPGSYMLNTIQYYPSSSQAHLDSHGRSIYPDNVNKLAVPNEYRRPSSAPLTPVEPKKIGRRFRRSSSVEEPHPDTLMMHENDLRRNNGLSRHELQPSGLCGRTCDGKSASDPNRIASVSHFSTMDGSIMSHSKPISYNYRHEYEAKRMKTETDSKEINYRPYMDNHHPYNNIKKNLAERFMKVEEGEDVHSSFKSSVASSSSSYHSGTSNRPAENYFTWGQYRPPSQESSYYSSMPHGRNKDNPGSCRGSYPGQSESFLTRPHHSEQLPIRPNHGEHLSVRPHGEHLSVRPHGEHLSVRPHSEHLSVRPHHNDPIPNRPPMHKGEQDARLQAMNTYFEMMANVQQVGNTPDGLFVRSREVIIQKSVANPNAPTVIHNQISHSSSPHPHHHDTHHHEFHEKTTSNQQSVVRHPHHLDLHQKGMNNQQGAIHYPPHDIHEKGVSTHQPTVIRGGIESSGGSSLITSHSVHGMTRPTNQPWSMVGTCDIQTHEKDQNRSYFRPPPSNAMDCGCAYPKRHLGECKLRNESFKPGENEHEDHSRYINMRNTPPQPQYEISNPYESPQYRRPDKAHPPELISYHDKHHNEYMNTPPNRAVKEMVTPPVLKNEAMRPDCTTSPSNIKKTPRPGPLVIPPTINNKIIYSTPGAMGRSNLPSSIYTPPPMLSPKSVFFNPPLSFQKVYTPAQTGYVCQTPRRVSLIVDKHDTPASAASASSAEKLSVEAPPEPKINVGPQFQATVPNVSDKAEAHKDVHRAGLVWSPLKEDKYKCNEVAEYLEMACSLALYGGGTNKEYALHILQRTRGNVKEAIRLVLSRRHILRADDPNADYHYSGSIRWNAKERLAFRTAYRTKGKIFSEIQKEIGTKSMQLCVEFYYLWKAKHPESFRVRTRTVEAESEQDEDEVPPTPTAAVAPLSTLREPVFECDYPDCLARFISRQALNGHIRVHGGSHTKTPDARRPPKEKANLTTPRTGQDGSAMSSPPKRKKATTSQPATPADGTPSQFQCKVCGRVFSKVKSRSAHMKTHVKKDENNKPIKAQKTKVVAEIKPLHKPFDILMHAVQNVGHSYDTINHSSNVSVHNTQPTYNAALDDMKTPFNPSAPFNPSMEHTKPQHYSSLDNTKPPFNPSTDNTKPSHQSMDNTKPPFNPSVDNTKPPYHPSGDITKPPFINPSLDNTKPPFYPSMDNTKPIFNPSADNSKPQYDNIVGNTKSAFDKNNNSNNNISSVNPST